MANRFSQNKTTRRSRRVHSEPEMKQVVRWITDNCLDDAAELRFLLDRATAREERCDRIEDIEQYERIAETFEDVEPDFLQKFVEAVNNVDDGWELPILVAVVLSEHFETAEHFCRRYMAVAEEMSASMNAICAKYEQQSRSRPRQWRMSSEETS